MNRPGWRFRPRVLPKASSKRQKWLTKSVLMFEVVALVIAEEAPVKGATMVGAAVGSEPEKKALRLSSVVANRSLTSRDFAVNGELTAVECLKGPILGSSKMRNDMSSMEVAKKEQLEDFPKADLRKSSYEVLRTKM